MYWTSYPRSECTWETFDEAFPLEESLFLGQRVRITYVGMENLPDSMLHNGRIQQSMLEDENLGVNVLNNGTQEEVSFFGTITRKHFQDLNKYAVKYTEAAIPGDLIREARKEQHHMDWLDLESLQVGTFDGVGAWKARSSVFSWQLCGYRAW